MNHEKIYAIATGPLDQPEFHYVGQTKKTINARFAEHLKGAANPLTHKPLYEHMRTVGIDQFRIVLLDNTESGLFEADYVRTLTEAGYKLLNASVGNNKVSKTRDYSWRDMNRAAERTLDLAELAERAASRRNLLHGDSQNLSKPEIVRQRLTNTFPTLDELEAYKWTDCAPELLPWRKLAKDTSKITAQYCKFGDYMLMIAWKAGVAAYFIKNTRNHTSTTNITTWEKCSGPNQRSKMLERVVKHLASAKWHPITTLKF